MSGLPQRFPRASLLNQAAMLESRIGRLLDQTLQKQEEADDRGMELVARKLKVRWDTLSHVRQLVNDARLQLWDLE